MGHLCLSGAGQGPFGGKIWGWHWFRIKISGAPLMPALMDLCSHHFTQSSTYHWAKMLPTFLSFSEVLKIEQKCAAFLQNLDWYYCLDGHSLYYPPNENNFSFHFRRSKLLLVWEKGGGKKFARSQWDLSIQHEIYIRWIIHLFWTSRLPRNQASKFDPSHYCSQNWDFFYKTWLDFAEL